MHDHVTDLTQYLRKHKEELNLADISRKSGLSSAYLKHVVAGRRNLTPHAAVKVGNTLSILASTFPTGGAQ